MERTKKAQATAQNNEVEIIVNGEGGITFEDLEFTKNVTGLSETELTDLSGAVDTVKDFDIDFSFMAKLGEVRVRKAMASKDDRKAIARNPKHETQKWVIMADVDFESETYGTLRYSTILGCYDKSNGWVMFNLLRRGILWAILTSIGFDTPTTSKVCKTDLGNVVRFIKKADKAFKVTIAEDPRNSTYVTVKITGEEA